MNTKQRNFVQWLFFYRPLADQQIAVLASINRALDDLQALLTLPSLNDGDEATIQEQIAKWSALRDQAAALLGSGEEE